MAFLANPTAIFTHCASPTGTAAGPGGRDAPWQTVDQAIAAVPSTCTAVGGALPEVRLLGSPASPNTYVSAGLTVSGALTIVADESRGAKLAGSGASEAILLANRANLTLRGVRLDPSLNGGGAAASCITIPSTFPGNALTCIDVLFENWTDHAINGPGGSRVALTLTDCDGVADLCNGYLYLNSPGSFPINVSGGSCQLARQTMAVRGGIIIFAHPPETPTVSITNWSSEITLDPDLTGSGGHYGIRVVDVPGATIVDGGTHRLLGNPGARTGGNIRIEFTDSDISGSKILNATIYNGTNGGIGAGIGRDGQVARQGTGCELGWLDISAGLAAQASGFHCAFLGCVTDSTAHDFTVNGGGIGFVDKGTLRTQAWNFNLTNCASSGIRSKGSVDAEYWDFTVTQGPGYSSAMMNCSQDEIGPVATTGLQFTGHWIIDGAAGATFLVQSAGDTATPLNNVYDLISGTYSNKPWQWSTGDYLNKAAWQAAVEPTATGNAP